MDRHCSKPLPLGGVFLDVEVKESPLPDTRAGAHRVFNSVFIDAALKP